MSAEHMTCPGCKYGHCQTVESPSEAASAVRTALFAGRDVGVFRVNGVLQVHSYSRGST